MELSNDLAYALFVFGAIGLLCCAILIAKLLCYFGRIVCVFLWPSSEQKERAKFQRYGKWAIVTGCTDGIGKEYAIQLAAAKLNVVLISRTPAKLTAVAQEIESKHKVETRTIAVDFTDANIYDRIRSDLDGLDLGVLVNNVGMDYPYPMAHAEASEADIVRVLNCNTLSLVRMTRIVLPAMVAKRRGLIINVGSTAALTAIPYIAMYSATKAFLDNFSQAITLENAVHGVDVQTVLPGYVATKLSGNPNPTFFVKLPSEYAATALKSVGRTLRCHGCAPHELQGSFLATVMPLLPFSMKLRIFTKEMGAIRERKMALQQQSGNQPARVAASENSELLKGTNNPTN